MGRDESPAAQSCGCDGCSGGEYAGSQAEYNLRWGVLGAKTNPGASDFWAASTALDIYERGPQGASAQDQEAAARMDDFVRVQRIGQAALSSVLDSRYTEAIRTTGINTTVVSECYTYAPAVFETHFDGGPICCPLPIVWTMGQPAANDAMPAGTPKGYVSAAKGKSTLLREVDGLVEHYPAQGRMDVYFAAVLGRYSSESDVWWYLQVEDEGVPNDGQVRKRARIDRADDQRAIVVD